MTKRDENTVTIPLNGGFNDRGDPMFFEPGVNTDVVGIRRGFNDDLMRRGPKISGSILTWATSSIPPSALVPCTVGSTLLTTRPDIEHYAVTHDTAAAIRSPKVTYPTASRPNAWFPVQVTDSRTSLVMNATTYPSFASIRTRDYKVVAAANDLFDVIDVVVYDSEGNIVVSPTMVVDYAGGFSGYAGQIYFTQHGNNKVALWYKKATNPKTIMWRLLTLSASGMTVGPERTAWQPAWEGQYCVDSVGDNDDALLLAGDSSAGATVKLQKYDVTTGVTGSSLSWAHEITGSAKLALSTMRAGGIDYVAAGWIASSSITKGIVVNASDLSSLTSLRTRNSTSAYSDSLVIAWTNTETLGPVPLWIVSDLTPSTSQMTLTKIAYDYTSSLGSFFLPNLAPAGHAGKWRCFDTDTTLPLIPFVRHYHSGSDNALDFSFVTDKSLEIYSANILQGTSFLFSPVVRLGVDNLFDSVLQPCRNLSGWDNDVWASYPVFNGDKTRVTANSVRAVDIKVYNHATASCNSGPVRSARTPGNGSTIAAAMPVVWDGSEILNGFPHAPHLSGTMTGGSGPALDGTFSFYAVYFYVDNAGQKHRSAPSNAYTVTLSAQAPYLYVSIPDTHKDGSSQSRYEIELYATNGSGSVPYAISGEPVFYASTVQFDTVVTGVLGNPIMYTAGGALPSECPPALWDIDAVEDRLWAIDAEKRNRILYTKTKENGIAYEWNGALELHLGSDAGKAIAIRNVNGTPVVLAEKGIYAVYGEGPDNNGGGALFNDPTLVAPVHVAPNSRNAAVLTPAGLLFETTRGYAIFDGKSVSPLDEVIPSTGNRLATLVSERCGEVYRFDSHSETFTWNYRNGHTSRWYPSQLSGSSFYAGAVLPPTGCLGEPLLLASDRALWFVEDSAQEGSDPWSISTGWITPAGFSGQASIKEWWITGRLNETGSQVTVAQFGDYSETQSSFLTFSGSIISSASQGTPSIVSLRGQPSSKRLRSIKLVISESCPSGGRGFIPLSLSIEVEPVTGHTPRGSTIVLSGE